MYTDRAESVASLAGERYVSLTSFKRDGTPVSTPVWVVSDDGRRLLVSSPASTWKVRRIARDPRVLVAACTFRGRERGPRFAGVASIRVEVAIDSLLRLKYGWQKRALDVVNGRSDAPWVTIEILDVASSERVVAAP